MDKKTCLYDAHVSLGALMSPFAGYIMPIQYSDITTEHNAVRTAVGMFDVSHMGEIFVSGPQAEAFVNYIFTNEISTMSPGDCIYGMMPYEDGGVVDDLLVYKFSGVKYLLVVNASNIDKDYEWIVSHKGNFNVEIENRSEYFGQIALQGPQAEETIRKALSHDFAGLKFYTFTTLGGDVIVSRTGYTGEDGFEIYGPTAYIVGLWQELLDLGVVPCGLGCRDTLRFESGMPLYGHELSESISPVMAGLGMFVKFTKDFIGSEALAKQKAEGVAKKLVGIQVDTKAPCRGGSVVLDGETPIGEVTTGYVSPTLGTSLCFALIDSKYAALGTKVSVQVRKKVFEGEVVKKRFYASNYKK